MAPCACGNSREAYDASRSEARVTICTMAELLLKVWGLTWLAGGLIALVNTALLASGLTPTSNDAIDRYATLTSGLSVVVNLALGTFLLLGARSVVRWLGLAGEGPEPLALGRYTLPQIQSVVFGGVGAFFLIAALRDVGELVYAVARQPAWDTTGEFAYVMERHQNELAGAAAQLVCSAVLLLNRSVLAALWSRVNSTGAREETPTGTAD